MSDLRHVPVSIFAIVAVVGIAILLMSVSYVPVFVPLAVQYVPYGQAVSQGSNTVIARLDLNQFLGDEIDGVSESQLAGLRSGTVHGKEVSADYVQNINFREGGLFDGCQVVFGKDEHNQVTDFLQCDDSVFKFTIDFSPGLRSDVEGGSLPDIEDEDIDLLGDSYTIVDTDIDTTTNRISLRMFGGYGSIEFEDTNYADDLFSGGGAKVNGEHISARVKIKASESGDEVTVYSIQYLLDADAAYGGILQITPLHCAREFLQDPLGLLSPNFDICYRGLSGAAVLPDSSSISGNQVHVKPLGDDEYIIIARNLIGQQYDIPLAQLPGSYGIKGRDFIFVEAGAPGAPNIALDDYFLVNSKNDVQGVSNVLRFDSISGNTVYFEDLAGSQRSATFDIGTGEGQLLVGQGTYKFVVTGGMLAVDQTNDGSISGAEARFVLPGGSRLDFGPGFTVTVITPSKLFDEPAGDEMSEFDILFGGNIDLNVPSPQATVAGYTFKLVSESGGVKKGLTKYGILYDLDTESDSDDLVLTVPGSYASSSKGGAGAEVYITLERAKLMKPTQVPAAPAVCNDKIITAPEYCDPPGSLCADQFKRSGTCDIDCKSCTYTAPGVCGNNLLDKGEECEGSGDCPVGFGCSACKCIPLPPSACGNNLLEGNEQCEKSVDCSAGMVCSGCNCIPAPPVEAPAPVEKPNIFARFFAWLARLFGG